ncbi:branched-chain amino acid transport system II carrier protein [Serratia sp. S4]|jgi:LIVCS family branched-chain amino acid:cation transporter|uniref:branched-chain amino acid transport system II carrier protein n=1 Tax=Serratia sp. S4 TaxID=768491 RepID=UPI00036F7FA9|nr:branched-chain amino acid transport system II carrier protein [Serratia sp. S4]
MTTRLSPKDIIALGFMTFALFVGAGNIIFPPMVGLQSGEHLWLAAAGFIVTAVVLPVIAVIALARVGGSISLLTAPIGRRAGLLLATLCYLALGPLFATPRTANVSFALGIAPFTGDGALQQFIYSLLFFTLAMIISLYPGRLLDNVGHILAPLKILALAALGVAALIWPAGAPILASGSYQDAAFSTGFVQGYLTMDTLSALMFGSIIVTAARSRGVNDRGLLMRYTLWASLIAGIGLTLVYICMFKLGAGSGGLVADGQDGAAILHAYVQHTFGDLGSVFMAILMLIACLVTAVGMTCACADFFSRYLPLSYRSLVVLLAAFAMLVSNLGLANLIRVSIPVLTAIYPPCIALVLLSFSQSRWRSANRVFAPVIATSLLLGLADGIKASSFSGLLPDWFDQLPLADQGLVWLQPTLLVLSLAAVYDRLRAPRRAGTMA